MLNKLLETFFSKSLKPEGFEHIQNSSTNNAKFVLAYKDILVGTLLYENPIWIFQYSDPFKMQNKLNILSDFPDKNRIYKSKELWPFFLSRIPSQNQNVVKEYLENGHPNDLAALLAAFGKRTITNPYLLNHQT